MVTAVIDEPRSQRTAILARDAATTRLRRLTLAVLGAGAAVAGVVAGIGASATHGRAAVVSTPVRAAASRTAIPPVPTPAATIPIDGAVQPPPASVSPPVASAGPPVVVSGGS